MTWLKNNLWVIIVLFVAQITIAILRDIGVIPWNSAIQSTFTLISFVLLIVCFVILYTI